MGELLWSNQPPANRGLWEGHFLACVVFEWLREVEYGFTDETWCALPLDGGTKRVISDGMQILTERGSILTQLKRPKRIPRTSK